GRRLADHGRTVVGWQGPHRHPRTFDLQDPGQQRHAAAFPYRDLRTRQHIEEAIYRSKAVGEPPLMLGISALHALKDAVASVGGYQRAAVLHAPATAEAVLMAVEEMKAATAAHTDRPVDTKSVA